MASRSPRLDLNPSAADRWTTCTASPQFLMDNAHRLPKTDTVFNVEGTTAHEVAAAYLQNRQPRTEDKYHCPVPVTKEMLNFGWDYMEYVEGLVQPEGRLFVEQKLPLWYMPERNAQVDAAVINQGQLHVIDYKYGAGVVVSPERSLQAAIYARCVGLSIASSAMFWSLDFPVSIHIFQPRGRAAYEGAPHLWETTWGEILELTNDLKGLAGHIQAKAAQKDGCAIVAKYEFAFRPSPKACQWCPAKGICEARKAHLTKDVEALATVGDSKPHLPSVKTISLAQLAKILEHKDELVKWLNDAETYARDFLTEGNKIPGFKLVLSRGGNRYWTNPTRAAKLLLETTILRKDEVIEEYTITPAQAEAKIGKHKFNVELTNLIGKPAGKPTIAPESDPRESLAIDGKSEFAPLESISLDDL